MGLENGEGGEGGERLDKTENAEKLEQGLKESISNLVELLREGESFEPNARELVRPFCDVAEVGARAGAELSHEIQGKLEPLREVVGEQFEPMAGGLETALEVFEAGLDWIKENPEAFEAALKLVVLLMVGLEDPSTLLQVLAREPELLGELVGKLVGEVEA